LGRRVALLGLVCGTAFAVAVLAGAPVLPRLFTGDPQVYRQAMIVWPFFIAMLPAAGVVFALDGVLLGAGDVRYLRNLTLVAGLGGFLPAIWLAYALRLGLAGVWTGLVLFIAIRLAALLDRLRTGRWIVLGASLPARR
ncbi:MAG TPA: MATE family efflux transporter, partial [Rugosimonospora sp.]|nr:MATE family efflux transporter [Rugosimonospora sp.]